MLARQSPELCTLREDGELSGLPIYTWPKLLSVLKTATAGGSLCDGLSGRFGLRNANQCLREVAAIAARPAIDDTFEHGEYLHCLQKITFVSENILFVICNEGTGWLSYPSSFRCGIRRM
jgi:hypothetical protein